jgi:hypothetical protein
VGVVTPRELSYSIMYVQCTCSAGPGLPFRDFGHVGFLCTFSNITVSAAAAAWDRIC